MDSEKRMNPEFKKLAERRADIYIRERFPNAMQVTHAQTYASGALDPVLAEARVCMARAEVYDEAADTFRECGETAVELAYQDKAQAEREKLEKILKA